MGYDITIRVEGPYALFTRPEMKVERVSYDVITPSAARGIIEAVYWKPAIHWVIDKIHVLREIQFTNIRRNEVSEKASVDNALQVMKGANKTLYIAATEVRQQRAAMVLRDVDYVIEAHFNSTDKAGPDNTEEKHYNMVLRRLRNGQHFHAPCLGTREFPAKVTLIEDKRDIPKSPLMGKRELGYILYDLDFSKPRDIKPMFYCPAIGVALNYMLSEQNPNCPIFLGDTTVVYWADTADKRYASAFYSFLNPEFQQEQEEEETEVAKGKRKRAKETEAQMIEWAESVRQGKAIDLAALREGLNDNTRFYVLGLAANISRLAVRFFLTEPFGVFTKRIMQHYDDLQIEKEYANQPTYISPYCILAECVSPKVTSRKEEVKKFWSLLGGAFMRAILSGAPYPKGLYATMLNRIRHDTDEEKRSVKIKYIRAAYIKAHLIRKYRHQVNNLYKEALQMSLNESYTHPAYVLGRLFAVLEKAQKEAIGENINATIKDRYFTSACAAPASVFSILLRLAHHWTTKAEYSGVSDSRIQELMGMLEAKPFPARLTLDEQGVFILGYYHQRAAFYAKKGNGEEASHLEE